MKYHTSITLLTLALLTSCQVSSRIKQTPVVGQIATAANIAVGQDEKNETASLFTPKNYKKQKFRITEQKLSYDSQNNPVDTSESNEVSFNDALTHFSQAGAEEQKEFVYACAARIDENYLEWLEDYVTGRASLDTGLGILAQGLSAAGTMFTPASTVRVLSGTSTFVQGVNSSIESKFFMSLTVLQQVPAMNKERQKTRKVLDRTTAGDFKLSAAIAQLDEYFMAGTQFTALGAKTEAENEDE